MEAVDLSFWHQPNGSPTANGRAARARRCLTAKCTSDAAESIEVTARVYSSGGGAHALEVRLDSTAYGGAAIWDRTASGT
jgi:hypothetical protein